MATLPADAVAPTAVVSPGRAPVRLVFADAEDPRVQAAVTRLAQAGALEPVVLNPPAGARLPSSVETLSTDDPRWARRCAEALQLLATAAGTPGKAAAPVSDPLLFAALYTRLGGADGGVAGSLSPSSAVIRAGLRGLGVAREGGLAVGCFLMQLGERRLTYADVAVTPEPDASQLAGIAISAADHHRAVTGEEPRVAMLSFSTHGSAEHHDVTKVREAVALVRGWRPDLCVDGELQFDVAVDPEVAARKSPASAVGGRANVFVFPDLGAGNIAYKITERLAGARALGSFVLGLRRPWIDLSRGCSADDVAEVAVLAARHVHAPSLRGRRHTMRS